MFKPNDDISGINEYIGFVRDAKNPTEKYIPVYKLDDYIGDDLFERVRYLNFVEDFLAHEVNPQYDYVNLYIDDSGEDDILSPEFIMVDYIVGLESIPAYEFLSSDFDKKYLDGASEEAIEDVRYVQRAIKNELFEIGEILKDEIADYGFVQKTKKLTESAEYPHDKIQIIDDKNGRKVAVLSYDDIEITTYKHNPDPWADPTWDYDVDKEYTIDYDYKVDLDEVIDYLAYNLDWDEIDPGNDYPHDDDLIDVAIEENIDRLLHDNQDEIMEYFREDAWTKADDNFEAPYE